MFPTRRRPRPWSPPTIAQWTYPNAGTHNTWPTEDNRYLVTTDETDGFTLRMWDIQNLPAVTQTDEFASPTGAIVHNAYVRGNICYMAHYRDGLRVADISDPNNIQSVGWYDTHPQDGSGYAGRLGLLVLCRRSENRLHHRHADGDLHFAL